MHQSSNYQIHSFEKALHYLESMTSQGVTPNVPAYSAAITACVKGGKPNIAIGLLERMKREGLVPDVIVYRSVGVAHVT
jgi:pentatricopeptide repeat protein